MAHTVSGKLRKSPYIKPGCGPQGESTMYAIELSEMIKSYNSDEKFYTNYSALFFAKTPAANDFYSKAFADGSFVVVSCEKLKTDIKQGQDGRTFVKMQMENPRLEGVMPSSDMWQPQQQSGFNQTNNQQQAPQQNQPPVDFDDDQIPF